MFPAHYLIGEKSYDYILMGFGDGRPVHRMGR